MGVIKQGILGGFSGKVANVVGGSWKGISYMRSLPESVANPNTAGQQAQRGAFASVVAFARSILTAIIKPCWDRFAVRESGYNAFVSANIDVFDSSGLNDPANLSIGQGSLEPVENFAAVEGASAEQMDCTWDDNSTDGNASATDDAFIVAWNEAQDLVFTDTENATRTDGARTVAITGSVSTDDIHAWMCFRKSDGTLVSNTSYDTYTIS